MKAASETKSPRRAVNISIKRDLVEKARAAGLNLSAIAEAAITRALNESARAHFLEEIARSVQEHEEYLAEYGSFADAVRAMEEEDLSSGRKQDDVA